MKLLYFNAAGTAQLFSSAARQSEVLWSSDDDEDFAEVFSDDVLDGDDEDTIEELADYLMEHDYLKDGEEFETEVEEDGPGDEDDEDEDDDADYVRRRA